VAGLRRCPARGRDVRDCIPTESPSQETGSFDRHQAGCSLRTPREHGKWLTELRVPRGRSRVRLQVPSSPVDQDSATARRRGRRPRLGRRHRDGDTSAACCASTPAKRPEATSAAVGSGPGPPIRPEPARMASDCGTAAFHSIISTAPAVDDLANRCNPVHRSLDSASIDFSDPTASRA
jgi:hypothetical protein